MNTSLSQNDRTELPSPTLDQAKQMLTEGAWTCVVCKQEHLYTSRTRGVGALLNWLESGTDLKDAIAADRVVGNGAAFLYVLLGVRAVYAGVVSRSALQTLSRHGIPCEYGELTDGIRNRTGDGPCPIEAAVVGETDPALALERIRERLRELSQK